MEPVNRGLLVYLALNEIDLCNFLTDYLRHKNCIAQCFGHYLALGSALADAPPSVLLIDEDFADKTTAELMPWLSRHATPNTAIVLLTSVPRIDRNHQDTLHQISHAVDLYVPFTIPELTTAIESALALRHAVIGVGD